MLNTFLSGFAMILEQIARSAAGVASYGGMYQPKEPEILKEKDD